MSGPGYLCRVAAVGGDTTARRGAGHRIPERAPRRRDMPGVLSSGSGDERPSRPGVSVDLRQKRRAEEVGHNLIPTQAELGWGTPEWVKGLRGTVTRSMLATFTHNHAPTARTRRC